MAADLNRWSQAATLAARARVDGEVSSYADGDALEAFLEERIARLADDLSSATSLLRFTYVLTLAKHLLATPRSNDADLVALLTLAHGLLRVEGITAASTLSHLLAEVHGLEAKRLAQAGQVDLAVWQILTGERQAHRSRDQGAALARLLEQARQRLRLGHTAFAAGAFEAIEASGSDELARRAAVWRVRTLRLCGDVARTEAALTQAGARHGDHAGTRMLLEWENAALEATATGKLEALMRTASKDDPRYTAANLITISLWTKATKSRAYLDKTVKTRTIRRSFSGEIPRQSPEHAALQALEALEDSYDNKMPLDVRLSALGGVLGTRRSLARVEWELLVLAATARTLSRLSQDAMADFYVAEYRALSLVLSQGKTGDVLSVVSDLVAKPLFKGVA